jgi:hypothetical protein
VPKEKREGISISIKGLAKFMTSSHVSQRKILRDFKYPDPEGSAQAIYYRDARELIRSYHEKSLSPEWLSQKASLLLSLAVQGSKSTGARLRHNARAINEYKAHFADEKYEILDDLSLAFTSGAVRITAYPDLHVRHNGLEKLLKFEFGSAKLDGEIMKIVAQGLFAAGEAAGLGSKQSTVMVIDVPRGVRYEATKLGSRLAREIDAACETIADVWQRL